MRTIYRALAYLVCGLVVVQAASHAWTSAGIGLWVSNGGVMDQSVMESSEAPPFPEALGFMIHAMNGMLLIPLVSLALLVVGLLVRDGTALKWAGIVLALVLVQVALGLFGHGMPLLALLHGGNALLLFGAAYLAVRQGLGAPVTPLHADRVGAPAQV